MKTTITTRVFKRVSNLFNVADAGKSTKILIRKARIVIYENVNKTTAEIFYTGKFYGCIVDKEKGIVEEIKEYIPSKDETYPGYSLSKSLVEEIMDSIEDIEYDKAYTYQSSEPLKALELSVREWNDLIDDSVVAETLEFNGVDFSAFKAM